jgi:hypothetical protein
VNVESGTEPVPRYRQSLSDHKGNLYVFGGESYKPYMYHNSVSKMTLAAHNPAGGALRGLMVKEVEAVDAVEAAEEGLVRRLMQAVESIL